MNNIGILVTLLCVNIIILSLILYIYSLISIHDRVITLVIVVVSD